MAVLSLTLEYFSNIEARGCKPRNSADQIALLTVSVFDIR